MRPAIGSDQQNEQISQTRFADF